MTATSATSASATSASATSATGAPAAAAPHYPRTIDNGAGERLTFVRKVGDRLECENVTAPGSGPPMHVHHRQEEALTVVEGTIGYQREGEPERFAGAGETVVFAPGEVHRFWNAGEGDLRCTGHIQPAGNVEFFLTEIFASQRAAGGTRPDPLDAAFLTRRYRSEFAMTEIPAPVQRLVFPVLIVLGRLLGRHAKYAGAPAPSEGEARVRSRPRALGREARAVRFAALLGQPWPSS